MRIQKEDLNSKFSLDFKLHFELLCSIRTRPSLKVIPYSVLFSGALFDYVTNSTFQVQIFFRLPPTLFTHTQSLKDRRCIFFFDNFPFCARNTHQRPKIYFYSGHELYSGLAFCEFLSFLDWIRSEQIRSTWSLDFKLFLISICSNRIQSRKRDIRQNVEPTWQSSNNSYRARMSQNEFEKRLNMVMGSSKEIILPDEQIAKSSTMDRICK